MCRHSGCVFLWIYSRFKLRNPNWQIYAVLSTVGFVWIYPYIANVYDRLTMSPERYHNHVKMNNSRAIYNAVCGKCYLINDLEICIFSR
jgi:hypothetical protein